MSKSIANNYETYAKLIFDCASDRFIGDLAVKCSVETYAISYETIRVFEEYFNRAISEITIDETNSL